MFVDPHTGTKRRIGYEAGDRYSENTQELGCLSDDLRCLKPILSVSTTSDAQRFRTLAMNSRGLWNGLRVS